MKAYVLLSGGIDSMSCVNFYKTLGYEVECIFCDYALLVWTAFSKIGFGTYKIVLGTHAGTEYPDCSSHFIDATNRVFDVYTNGTVILEAPFINWQKADIVAYCRTNSLPYHYTYSCEMGSVPPCGRCLSCLDRREFLHG